MPNWRHHIDIRQKVLRVTTALLALLLAGVVLLFAFYFVRLIPLIVNRAVVFLTVSAGYSEAIGADFFGPDRLVFESGDVVLTGTSFDRYTLLVIRLLIERRWRDNHAARIACAAMISTLSLSRVEC